MPTTTMPRTKDDLDTPALCIDLDRMESNIASMVATCRAAGVDWRPHAKCHKCIAIGRKLVDAGAIGLTCAKLGEAEVFGAAGIPDLLIANLLVGKAKVARLVALRKIADPIVCIDSVEQAAPISRAVTDDGQCEPVRVIIEVDIGLHRVGVAPGEPTLQLARQLQAMQGLRLVGIMGYEGHLLTLENPRDKEQQIHAALAQLVETRDAMRAAGLPCPIVSCGGTGSYPYSATHPGITELQAGGAIFMDEFYRNRCQITELEYALTVLATVVSRPAPNRAIIDAGRKTMNPDHHMPRVLRDGVRITSLSAEHGSLELEPAAQDLRIGDRLEIIPGYGDLTTVLHNEFVATRGDRIEAIWPLDGRGRLQ